MCNKSESIMKSICQGGPGFLQDKFFTMHLRLFCNRFFPFHSEKTYLRRDTLQMDFIADSALFCIIVIRKVVSGLEFLVQVEITRGNCVYLINVWVRLLIFCGLLLTYILMRMNIFHFTQFLIESELGMGQFLHKIPIHLNLIFLESAQVDLVGLVYRYIFSDCK